MLTRNVEADMVRIVMGLATRGRSLLSAALVLGLVEDGVKVRS